MYLATRTWIEALFLGTHKDVKDIAVKFESFKCAYLNKYGSKGQTFNLHRPSRYHLIVWR